MVFQPWKIVRRTNFERRGFCGKWIFCAGFKNFVYCSNKRRLNKTLLIM